MGVAVNAPLHMLPVPPALPPSSWAVVAASSASPAQLQLLRPFENQRRKRRPVVDCQVSSSSSSTSPYRKAPKHTSSIINFETTLGSHDNDKDIIASSSSSPVATRASKINALLTTTTKGKDLELEVAEIKERCRNWQWKGHAINYFVYDVDDGREEEEENGSDINPTKTSSSSSFSTSNHPLLLVHGFGASIPHWRRNIMALAQSHTVYAIDLLGFGASDKPIGFGYTMEVWAELILDFLDEIVQRPTVLIGNSVGSLACVIAASDSTQSLVRGLVLLNCAGGMNNKAVVDDWRIKILSPLLWFIDFLLNQRKVASFIFERVTQRDNLRNILLSVYENEESVDEDLVQIIREPALSEGALDAFVSIVTGPPGPNPMKLMPRITLPILVLWGDQDTFTPLDGPVGKYFLSLPSQLPNIRLVILEGVGHCPHDDRPNLVHEKLLPWLACLPVS